ncbi:MAG: T9SS type A sorting domain-containing protein [Candidatus Cloacimonetes bacterium]|nr:T9SS type A sorting domain-containing protein [Candidatus Cloacimonadota bacterium]
MKKIIIWAAILLALPLWSLDPVYHTNEEIFAELDSLQQMFPDYMLVRVLGFTGTDSLPVYAVKISDNVTVDEDEPAVLFLGQCHAEEVMGVEISMALINELLMNGGNPYNVWRNNLEIWIVPTHNPEGLQVVTDSWDTTYRKNKTDNNGNGLFDFVPGPGNDDDGVDLNRNYDFNWVHGDTLNAQGNAEFNDYYKGPAPWSELEAQYLRQLCDEQHFIYSIAWHSSRTGNLSEKVFYPWNWEENKPCPDEEFNAGMASTVAHLIEKETGGAYYEPSGTLNRNPKAHDWFYNEYGTLQFEIEAGTANLQPGPALLQDTISRCINAPHYMMNRALGYDNVSGAMLTGHVTNAVTGEPLVAEYLIEERKALSFTPRMTDELYGRFWWQCSPNTYTLHLRQKGYADSVITVTVNGTMPTTRNLALMPLAEANISGSINAGDEEVKIIVHHDMGDEEFLFPAGSESYSIDWWEGQVDFIVAAEGYTPKYVNYDLQAGENVINIELQPEIVIFNEDWSGDFSQWSVEGDWYIGYDEDAGRNFAKDTPNDFYANESEVVLTTSHFFNLFGGSELSLIVDQKYHTEHEEDFCIVEISLNDGNNWIELSSISGVNDWDTKYYDLSSYADNYMWIRFRLITDDTVDDPGWWLGNIKLVSATMVDNDEDELVSVTKLRQSYPNPFHLSGERSGECRIDFSLATPSTISLNVYNVKGQLIKKLTEEFYEQGDHTLFWNGFGANGHPVASGVYFYVLSTGSAKFHQKMLIIK